LKKIFTFLLVIFIIFIVNSIKAEYNLKIALLDFTPENTQQTYARAVRNLFEVSLYKTGNFSILERNKVEMILKEQGFQLTGCIDTSCAVQIGKILSADMVVIGSLNKLGKYTVTAKFVNVRHGRIELADSETAETEDGIQNAVNVLAVRMAQNIANKSVVADKEKIVAADDSKKKKSPSEKSPYKFNLTISGSYLLPQGRFSNLVEAGYGGTASISVENMFIRNSLFGIETGYWYFPGKKNNVDYCTMIPTFITIGYHYNIFDTFYVQPLISAGAAYNTMNWDKYSSTDGTYKFAKESEIESVVKAGVGFGYVLSDLLSVQIGAEYCIILEQKHLGFLLMNAGVGVNF
jgi:hypothetical protein